MNNNKNNRLLIGNRVKSVRMLAGFNRKAFSEKTGISAATLRSWEEPNEDRNGITPNGIHRLIKALSDCGIFCSEEWLSYGKEPGPTPFLIKGMPFSTHTWDEESSIIKDIDAFKRNNHNTIVATITDGLMLPFYSYGDYVGGSKQQTKDLKSLLGHNCIIELKELTLVRKIILSKEPQHYILSVMNQDAVAHNLEISQEDILSVAKIVWHRSKEKIGAVVI